MKNSYWYDTLGTNDIRIFESSLIQWCEREKNSLSVILFDEQSLKPISLELKKRKDTKKGCVMDLPDKIRYMEIENLILEWYVLDGTQCVVKSIKKIDGTVLYSNPKRWDYCSIWYAY